jgi:DNA-binding GntR family transcriptional regulator
MTDFAIAPLPTPSAPSATDLVFATLYDAVVRLNLPPGTKVSEAEVARQLDVSRQPVRDAFFRLSKLGFLSIRPQRATLITRISQRAVREAQFTRTALEVECLRHAAQRMTKEGALALRANLDAQKAALADPDPAGFHALDEALHELLCGMAGHPHAWRLILEQKAHMDRVRFLTLSDQRRARVYEEHRAIVEALIGGDLAAAETELRAHLTDILSVLARAEAQHPEYFAVPG